MKETLDFIIQTGQPLAYIESNPSMRFKNIDYTPTETIYVYSNGQKDITIRVPKSLKGKIEQYQQLSKDIYNQVYVGETTRNIYGALCK